MNIETGTIEITPVRDLYGKLIGIIQYRRQLKPICESLTALGIREVEVLDGPTGIEQLEKWKDGVSQYLFGDAEGTTLQRFIDAVKSNFIVFAAVVESSSANEAAEIAKSNEATDVTHFGNAIITNY